MTLVLIFIAELPEYQNIGGSASAFEWTNRVFYAILQAQSTTPFELVGIDVNHGSIVSKVQACEQSYKCPSCLEFLNKMF